MDQVLQSNPDDTSRDAGLTNHRLLAELQRHKLLRKLVSSQVVAEVVANEQPDPKALKAKREKYFQDNKLKDKASIEEHLTCNGLSHEDLDWQIALPLRISSYSLSRYRHKSEAHFLARKSQLDTIEYSLIRTRDVCLANELYHRIEAQEEDFSYLASKYTEGLEKNTKGLVGPIPASATHPVLAKHLRTSHPGIVMDPMLIEGWWIVARLERYNSATFDDAMTKRMCLELFEYWIQEETRSRMKTYSVID